MLKKMYKWLNQNVDPITMRPLSDKETSKKLLTMTRGEMYVIAAHHIISYILVAVAILSVIVGIIVSVL